MIIWSGLGIVVVAIVLVCGCVCEFASIAIFGPGHYQAQTWAQGIALLLSAVGCQLFATYLRKRPNRVFIDKATGQETTLRRYHSLMAVPVRFWPFILAAFSVYLFLKAFTK